LTLQGANIRPLAHGYKLTALDVITSLHFIRTFTTGFL
jgi:hypothetical protein